MDDINNVIFLFQLKSLLRFDQIIMAEGDYGCSLKELRDLMEYRGLEAQEKIAADYGNISEICKRLKTSLDEGSIRRCFCLCVSVFSDWL